MKGAASFIAFCIFLAACGPKEGIHTEFFPNGKLQRWMIISNGDVNGKNYEWLEDGRIHFVSWNTNGLSDSAYNYQYKKDTTEVWYHASNYPSYSIQTWYRGKVIEFQRNFDLVMGNPPDTLFYVNTYRNEKLFKQVIHFKGNNHVKSKYYFDEGTVEREEVWTPGTKPNGEKESEEEFIERMRKDLLEMDEKAAKKK